MKTLTTRRYQKYLMVKKEYRKKRKELLEGPEDELAKIAVGLKIHELSGTVEKDLKKMIAKAWRIYKKIYAGEPTTADVDKFLSLSGEIITYEDFLSGETIKSWKAYSYIVEKFKERVLKEQSQEKETV